MAVAIDPPYCPPPPPDLRLSPVFNLCGPESAARWCREELGIEHASERWIHDATLKGKIRYARLCGRRYYSSLEIYKFVMSQAKFGGGRTA